MGWFSLNRKSNGLMAITVGQEGLYAVSLLRHMGEKPVLKFLSFYPKADRTWSELLERLAKDANTKNYQCSLLLLPGEYQLFAIDALNVPRNELKSAMRWKLKDLLDYHIDDATIDVLDVPGDANAGGRGQVMFAIAARNQLIAERQTSFLKARIKLSVIDVPDMAQRNLSALLEQDRRGLAMLSFDAHGGLLTVTFGGELYLSRRLDVRLDQLQTDDSDKKAAIFERITLELQRSLDHFDRQHHTINTSKLVLALPDGVGDDLQNYLISNLYLPVELLQLDQLIDLSKIPDVKEALRFPSFLMTIGAALRQEDIAA